MDRSANATMEIEAQLRAPAMAVQLVHYHFGEPPNDMLRGNGRIRVELCLGSRHRSARGCFSGLWSKNRFERIGDMFVAHPRLDLWAKSDEDSPLTSIVCEIDLATVLNLYDREPELTDAALSACLDLRDAKIRQLLLRLAEEARHPGFASPMLVELIGGQLAIEMVRHASAINERQPCGGLASWQLRLIDERLREVREPPGLSVLAELCRLSVRQLARGFRVSRGYAIGAYVASSQIEHAKGLLASDESVTAIGCTLGFSSNSNFCFAFRRATGLAPGRYRQTLLRAHQGPRIRAG